MTGAGISNLGVVGTVFSPEHFHWCPLSFYGAGSQCRMESVRSCPAAPIVVGLSRSLAEKVVDRFQHRRPRSPLVCSTRMEIDGTTSRTCRHNHKLRALTAMSMTRRRLMRVGNLMSRAEVKRQEQCCRSSEHSMSGRSVQSTGDAVRA